jgi:hypothetical protein
VDGLRVPQNPQWMSAPRPLNSLAFSSETNFFSAGASNCTSSGCGAPQFTQVFSKPLLRVLQFGQVHSSSINPLLLRAIVPPQ